MRIRLVSDLERELDAARSLLLRQQARQSYTKARKILKAAPDWAPALELMGIVSGAVGRIDDAIRYLERAVLAAPKSASAYLNLGKALHLAGRHQQAETAYIKALQIEPRLAGAHHDALAYYFSWALTSCDWSNFQQCRLRLAEAARRGAYAFNPYLLMLTLDDPDLHQVCAKNYAREAAPAQPVGGHIPARRPERLKIGYVSADFRVHPTAFLAAGLFEKHDRNRFEIVAVSLADDGSDIGRRILNAADVALNAADQDGQEIAHRLRAMGVDIAIDLMGHTAKSNFDIFRNRAAPIQVGFLGYPGTTGSEAVSYLIVDPVIATDEVRRTMTEQPVIMPHCYQCNDDQRPWPQDDPARAQCGLPENAFVYCSFNQTRKITPEVFDLWMRILHNVESSVLWLYVRFDGARANLLREAEKRGVAPERIVFAERLPQTQHLARFRLADLMLDTFPCGAHTTASDALWMGCPVVTCAGRSFASRVAASLLHTVGLPELVTKNFAEYEELAVELAGDPAKLASLKARLAAARTTSPLFDTARFCRDLERAYDLMWERHISGRPPEAIDLRERSAGSGEVCGVRFAPPAPTSHDPRNRPANSTMVRR
ncbi:MAG TPA: tetratricopeptide repeat protein [Hyphomicrobiaceae bacterium]|nr:tetratricopeptide repeat protein [Hyphomicrobiaceae bacterium]